jgi:hypothetical protein
MPLSLNVSGVFGVEPSRFRVVFPGWDDVVHWQPRSTLDEATYQQWRARTFGQLAASPTPQVVRDFGRIGQEIDNVQDALVTLSVLGRLSVKLTGRLLPGVGWVATAADVLNLLNVFYPPNAFGVGRWLANMEKKRGYLEGSKLTGGTYKRRLMQTLKTGKVGLGYGEVLQMLQTTDELFGVGLSLGPIFGAASDALFGIARGAEFEFPGFADVMMSERSQSALFRVDEYFGVPVSRLLNPGVAAYIGFMLGALGVGAEGFSSATVAYDRLRISWPGVIPALDFVAGVPVGTTEQQIARGLSPFVGAAQAGVAAVLYAFGATQGFLYNGMVQFGRAAAWLGGYRDDLPWETHLDLVVGQALMVGFLKPAMTSGAWGDVAARFAGRPWWGGALPLVEGAGDMTVGQVSAAVRDGGGRAPQVWLESVPSGVLRDFAHELVNTTVDELLEAMEGPGQDQRVDSGQLWRAGLAMQEHNLLWPIAHTDGEGLAYILAAAGAMPALGEGFLSRGDLEGVFREVWPDVDSAWDRVELA